MNSLIGNEKGILTLDELENAEKAMFGDTFLPPQAIIFGRENSKGKVVPSILVGDGHHRIAIAKLYGRRIEIIIRGVYCNIGNIHDSQNLRTNVAHLQAIGDFPAYVRYIVGFNKIIKEIKNHLSEV